MYKRFKWKEEVRFTPEVFNGIEVLARRGIRGKKIFVGSTMELFGKWVEDKWMKEILWLCSCYPQYTFIFLTKMPANLKRWSPFPKNCWIGVSTTGFDKNSSLEDVFGDVLATVKFVSIEPMLDYTPLDFRWVNWVIIGQQTPTSDKTEPNLNWLHDTVVRADKEKLPVFLKDNLKERINKVPFYTNTCRWALNSNYELRQEFPK
jgi:protein gp37